MMRLTLPQGLAATFQKPVNVGNIEVSSSPDAATVQNNTGTARPDPWKIRGLCSGSV